MRTQATATFEASAFGFMSIFTPGTGRRGVCFVLKHDFAAKHVPLVGDQVSEPAVAPLVKLLVGPFAIIQSLANISHIPDHERLHPCLEQGGDQCPRLFVFNISYLVLDSGKMPLLCLNKLPPTLRSFLLGVDLAVELGFELVLIPPFGSE